MLEIYDEKPSKYTCIDVNDLYFDAHTDLVDDKFTDLVLQDIDKAKRVSNLTFTGRNKEWGNLFKINLSTGTKTLLNIKQHPEVCFNIIECGTNVIDLLPMITDGKVFSKGFVPFRITDYYNCNILYNNKQFTDLNVFIKYYNEVYDAKHSDEL